MGKGQPVISRRYMMIGGAASLATLALGGWAGWRGMGTLSDQAAAAGRLRATMPAAPENRDLIRYATLAPNGHNTQPWMFRESANRIELLPDFTRRTPVVDPDDHHLFASLGCAAENLAIAAGQAGRAGEIVFDPSGSPAVSVTLGSGNGADRILFEAIPQRQSTRSDYDGSTVGPSDLRLLAEAAAVPGVDLVLITDRPHIDQLRDLVIAGNTAQMADAAFVTELKHWLRFSPSAAMATGDGLFSACAGSPILPQWMGQRVFEFVFTADAENAKYVRQIDTSSGLAVFVSARNDPEHWVQAGRACQRFALQATALGLKHAFLNQPAEVPGLRDDLAALVGLPGRRPDIVMRFGRAPAMPWSARRPVESVMAV